MKPYLRPWDIIQIMKMTFAHHSHLVRVGVLLLFTATFVLPATGATFTVTKIADTNDGNCDADCSLREAIAAANSAPTDDVINFEPAVFGVPQTITLGGSELIIGSGTNLTINGPGPNLLTISGNDQSRVVFVGESSVASINGLKITRGNGFGSLGNSHGGGLRTHNFTSVFLNNTIITNNRASGNGGNLDLSNSTLSVTNSVISDGTSGTGASGLFAYSSNITIVNSTLSRNTSGAIFISNGTLNIQSSNISNNTTAGDGGAILNFGGTVIINSSTLNENVGRQGGGAISGVNGSITIDDSSIIGNRAEFFGGGGIKSYGRLTISNSTIANNTAINSEGGGGIYGRQSGSTLDIRDSILGTL